MAKSSQDGFLGSKDIPKVANALPPPPGNVTFARGCLGLHKEYVDSIVNGEDREKINQSFIQAWMEQNPGQDQKKKLVAIFKNAAQEGYYVDLSVVEAVLGLPDDGHVSPVSGDLPEPWLEARVVKESVLSAESVQLSKNPPTYSIRAEQQEFVIPRLVKKLEDLAKGVLKHKAQIVEIVHGQAVTIQALHSNVILHVPDGVYGFILGNIHTDHWRFKHLVSDTDCIIGPICDYQIFDFLDAESIPEASKRKNFIIEVPHIVKNIEEVNGKIQVMRQPNGSTALTPIEPLLSEGNAEPNGAFYSMEKNHVKISTPHFSRYIVTAKGINCCSGSAEMLVFSKMDMNGARPLFHVNIYLRSLHYVLQDYSQKTIAIEESMKMKLMTHQEILLSNDPYDSSKSFIEINIHKSNEADVEKWKAYKGTSLSLKKSLKDALKYRDEHLCKSPPTQLPAFHLLPVGDQSDHRIDLDVTVAVSQEVRKASRFPFSRPRKPDEEHPHTNSYMIVIHPWPTVSGTSGREFTDAMMLTLSQKINKEDDLRELATTGLGVSDDVISASLYKYPQEINLAVHEVLKI